MLVTKEILLLDGVYIIKKKTKILLRRRSGMLTLESVFLSSLKLKPLGGFYKIL